MVKNLPAIRETRVQSLGWKDPLEMGKPTDSSTLAWRIPWTEEPGSLQSMGMQRANSLGKTLVLGKIEGKRRAGRQRMRWLDDIIDSMDMSLSKLREILACCSPWSCKESDTIE